MEQTPPKPMTPFDELVTPGSLYTLKLMLPYTPPTLQRMLGIYIKFTEFRFAMEHFYGFPPASSSSILENLKNYMSPEEKEQMEQMEEMMNMMEMLQNMQSMSDDSNDFNPMDLMKGVFNNE